MTAKDKAIEDYLSHNPQYRNSPLARRFYSSMLSNAEGSVESSQVREDNTYQCSNYCSTASKIHDFIDREYKLLVVASLFLLVSYSFIALLRK